MVLFCWIVTFLACCESLSLGVGLQLIGYIHRYHRKKHLTSEGSEIAQLQDVAYLYHVDGGGYRGNACWSSLLLPVLKSK